MRGSDGRGAQGGHTWRGRNCQGVQGHGLREATRGVRGIVKEYKAMDLHLVVCRVFCQWAMRTSTRAHMHMHIHTLTYVLTRAHTCVLTHRHVCTHVHSYTHAHAHTGTDTKAHMRTHASIHTHTLTDMHVRTYTCVNGLVPQRFLLGGLAASVLSPPYLYPFVTSGRLAWTRCPPPCSACPHFGCQHQSACRACFCALCVRS